MKKLTILIAALALVCFSVPAMAVDWNFYGNARVTTFYESRDFGDGTNAAGTDDEDQDLQWDLQGNSRIGATIKAENVNARFEFGVTDSDVTSRRIFGVWNFGAGKLKVGKDYTPITTFVSGQVFNSDDGLLDTGNVYGRRKAQIGFEFGRFQVALVQQSSGFIRGLTATETTFITVPNPNPGQPPITSPVVDTTETNGDVDEILPKLEARFGMGFDTWNFNVFGGAQYFSIEDVESLEDPGSTDDLDVTSWCIGGDAGVNFAAFYIKAGLSYGQNIGDAGWSGDGPYDSYQGGFAMWDGDDDTNETYTFQGLLVAGYKMSDMLSFEAGGGYRHDRTDEGIDRDTKPWAVYLQSSIQMAPGVFVIPEVGYYDLDNAPNDDEAGSVFYIGGKWQINF